MKKLLLVNTNTETKPYPVPPLGLSLLASVLEDRWELYFFDGTFRPHNELPGIIEVFQPDYIGLSIRNVDDMVYDDIHFYVDEIREKFVRPIKNISNVPLIAGGAGFSIFPEVLMQQLGLDYGIVGPAEVSFPRLLEALDKGEEPKAIPGLLSAAHQCSSPSIKDNQTDCFFTAHAAIDKWLDFTPYRNRGAYSVQTKKGCGFHCIYCTYPVIEGRCLHLRKAVDIVDEMQQASIRLGDVVFEFADSVFNDPPGHAEAICSEILRRGLRFRMRTMGVNPSGVTEELLKLMIGAGFTQIDCTPDTASPVMLKRMGKNFSLGELAGTAKLIRRLALPSMWFFMFGGPGESVDTINETFDFIDEHIDENDLVHLTLGLRIYPGTPLQQIAIAEGQIAREDDLLRPVFYFSAQTPHAFLKEYIISKCATRSNCVPSFASAPSPGMMQMAMKLRNDEHLSEPMFRTLLRIKRQIDAGTLIISEKE